MLFVTGITGHTGRWFLQKLIEERYSGPLRVLTRQERDTSLLEKSGLNLEIARGSLEDKAFLEKAMDGVAKRVFLEPLALRYESRLRA